MKLSLATAALLALSLPASTRAHEVEFEIDRRGAEVAVRAQHEGGAPLSDASYEVVPPAAASRPGEAGRTDRHGWLVFVPDAPGTWSVRIADATGHGGVVKVEVPAVAAATPSGAPLAATPPRPTDAPAPGKPGALLRTGAGVAGLAAIFAALFAVQRRRAARR
jgi:nickel transport protein